MTLYECQNCGKAFPEAKLVTPIPDLEQRVMPGEPMPAGECPECGALCHEQENPNSNCLEGMQCPQCGSFEPFAIVATTCCTVCDDEAEASDLEWGEDACCRCIKCDHEDVVAGFRRYFVFNETDGVCASPDAMTHAEAEAFLAAFHKRFEAQGYYASVKGLIPIGELQLKLVAEGEA